MGKSGVYALLFLLMEESVMADENWGISRIVYGNRLRKDDKMALIGTYYTIEPKDWLFSTHGDVVEAKRRAQVWFDIHKTYDGAE